MNYRFIKWFMRVHAFRNVFVVIQNTKISSLSYILCQGHLQFINGLQ